MQTVVVMCYDCPELLRLSCPDLLRVSYLGLTSCKLAWLNKQRTRAYSFLGALRADPLTGAGA
jgi:hypothetical protein